MIRKTILFLLHVLAINTLFSQDFVKPNMGELSDTEIAMTQCDFDTAAEAVVLFDVGELKFVEVRDGYNTEFTRHKRVKIFTEKGVSQGAVHIPLQRQKTETEKVTFLAAYTYVIENGEVQKIELDPSTIFTEKINEWWKQTKFVFPNLKPGAIVEFKYTVESPFIFSLPEWEFQSDIPTLYSQHYATMIPFFEYCRLTTGIDSFDFENTKESSRYSQILGGHFNEVTYTSALKNVPAFKDESYITSRKDYIKKFEFQLHKVHYRDGSSKEIIPTWEKLNEDLLDDLHFGKYLSGCKKHAKNALASIDTTGKSKPEIIKALIEYTKQNFYWSEYYGYYASQMPRDFITSKTGNIADINLFLVALLREVGFNADPVILSTRKHGKVSLQYPILDKFNYVLVYVNEPEFNSLVDATDLHSSYTLIPPKCINEYGLVIKKKTAGNWLQINYNQPSLKYVGVELKLDLENALINVKGKLRAQSFEAYMYRSRLKDDSVKIKKHFSNDFDEMFNVKTLNYKDLESPYEISFEANKELSFLNDYVIIKPLFHFAPSENRLKQEVRDYPVDFMYPEQNQYSVDLYLPSGYTLEKLPEPFFRDDELASIQFNVGLDSENNRVKIFGTYILKKAIYQPENYSQLKQHFDDIIQVFNPELVLSKVKQEEASK